MMRLTGVMPKEFARGVRSSKGKYKKVKELDETIKGSRNLEKLK